MKKLMIAVLGLSLLSGSAMVFAQDSADAKKMDDTSGKKKKKSKKAKKMDAPADSTAAPK